MGPKKRKKPYCFVAGLALLAGCANVSLPDIIGPTVDYAVTVCAVGPIRIPAPPATECPQVATVSIPASGTGLVDLGASLVAPYLLKSWNLKACRIAISGEPRPADAQGRGTTFFTAQCNLNGVEVTELVTLTLTPVAPGTV